MDTARCANNDLGTFLEGLHVVTDAGAANTGMALNVHEITNGNNDLLNLLGQFTGRGKDQSLALLDVGVKFLENGDGESGSLSRSGLGLGNNIMA